MKLPHRPLTDFDLLRYAKTIKIPYFRGVFMRNELPISGPYQYESGIINLDNKEGSGTHWVAYKKFKNETMYFDSFGNLAPPTDLVIYLGDGSLIKYNHERYQNYDSFICGHLCLKFLCNQLNIKSSFNLYKRM